MIHSYIKLTLCPRCGEPAERVTLGCEASRAHTASGSCQNDHTFVLDARQTAS